MSQESLERQELKRGLEKDGSEQKSENAAQRVKLLHEKEDKRQAFLLPEERDAELQALKFFHHDHGEYDRVGELAIRPYVTDDITPSAPNNGYLFNAHQGAEALKEYRFIKESVEKALKLLHYWEGKGEV